MSDELSYEGLMGPEIAADEDLLLSQPHHGPLMPIGLQLAMPGEYPITEEK